MNENKYYTPEVEDLYIGYIYEVKCIGKPIDDYEALHWKIYTITKEDLFEWPIDYEFRTKYLDKEDVESLGWKLEEVLTGNTSRFKYNDVLLVFNISNQRVRINHLSITKFDGQCKSINELKKIMKWLNIL